MYNDKNISNKRKKYFVELYIKNIFVIYKNNNKNI